ncbi:(2Fe-2S)-binding protein [Azospirillum doebereinerae]
MYVCICHGLNDKKVKAALTNGAKTPASVFRHHGCQVQCGKCVPTMREMAADHSTHDHHAHGGDRVACPNRHSHQPANSDAVPAYGVAAE